MSGQIPCEFTVVTASNQDAVLEANLQRSPMLREGNLPIIVERGHTSASVAYNAGLRQTTSDFVVFAHQDVYFPRGWNVELASAIEFLSDRSPHWAILGVWGIRSAGDYVGRVWCTGSNCEYVRPSENPTEVVAVDEIVIVLRKSSKLQFDERLPGYHLYATDLILQAQQQGMSAFVFDGPVVHNSRRNPNPFDGSFFKAHRHMQRKWSSQLPIRTATVPITRTGWPLYRAWLRREWRRLSRQSRSAPRHPSPELLARRLGYESEDDLIVRSEVIRG